MNPDAPHYQQKEHSPCMELLSQRQCEEIKKSLEKTLGEEFIWGHAQLDRIVNKIMREIEKKMTIAE